MCLWCTATRNLQRPELDWNDAYPLQDERDALLFQSEPIPGSVDPPLSFVQSISALAAENGAVMPISFSPENEGRIENTIEAFKNNRSGLSRLTVHSTISFADARSSSLPPYSPDHSLSHSPPRPQSTLKTLTLSTSAINARFMYPRGVTSSTYVSKLAFPGEIWKAFNPALCRREEKPKLLILRDCFFSGSHGKGCDSELMSGRYDVGAIDYRAHYDCSYHVWFIRRVGDASVSLYKTPSFARIKREEED